MSQSVATARAEASGATRVNLLVRLRGVTILAALAILVAVMSAVEPNFLSKGNLTAVLLSASIVAILAVGQAIVIISGNIDLSVGSVVGLCAFVTGLLLRDGWSLPLGIGAALLLGAVLGLGNGLVVGVGGAPSIVATLGTLNIYRGILLVVAGGKAINAYDLPRSFLNIASDSTLGVPNMVSIAAVVVVVFGVLMRWSISGRQVYAMGGNVTSAAVLGIKTTRLTIGVFVLSGLIAGGAGVLWGAQYATVQSSAATGLELTVITAVVVGGVNIFGGGGNVGGAVVGALLLATVANSLTLISVSPFWLGAIQGALILAAIATDATVSRSLRRLTGGNRRVQ